MSDPLGRRCATIPSESDPWLGPGLAIILDMDGVIIDSNPVHRRAWSEYYRRFGIPTTESLEDRMYGKRNDEIVRDLFGAGLDAEEVRRHGAAKEELYRQMIGSAVGDSLVPGVREFLQRHRGAPMGLATNAERANVDFLLDGAGLRPYFRAVVDGGQVRKPKPDPEIYWEAARQLGADPADCIVFEDSLPGIRAARAAGTRVVGLRTTHPNLPEVDLAIDHFFSAELEPWLRAQHASR